MSIASRDGEDAVASGKSAVSSAVAGVTHKAGEVADKLKDAGGRAAGYVHDQYDHLKDEARDAYSHAREKARTWEHEAEEFVQQRPWQAMLIAAGIGALVALLWRRK